jgi:ABC-2 type transport system permease protein
VENLEYEITSAILKLISEETPTIGFLTGHGEMTTGDSLSTLAESLRELYTVQDVDLGTGRLIADNINTLVIAQPAMPFTERHQYVIDQFVMRGGKLVVMSNGIKFDQMTEQAQFQAFPLDSLLSNYGAKINNDLVADLAYNQNVPTGSMGGFRVYAPYPLFPKISPPDGFPSGSPATRGLDSLSLPFVSSLTLLYDRIADETEVIELAKSSVQSYSYPVPVDLSPRQQFNPPGGESDLKKQLVAVQLKGVFTSAFAGQAVPAFDPDPSAPEGAMPEMDTEPMMTTSQPTSVVVIGNANFVDNNWMQAPGNGVFIQNLMETLNIGEKLIDIRSRTVTNRPLNPELTPAEKNRARFWGYIFVPVLVTVLGVGRFYLKAQRKKLMAAIHQAEQKQK